MTAGLWELQKSVKAVLEANAAVQALVGSPARIYDVPPPDATYPFVLIGDMTSTEWGARDFSGQEVTMSFVACSEKNRGSSDVKQICDAIRDALHDRHIPVSAGNGAVIICFHDGTDDPILSDDGNTWSGTIRFRIIYQH